MFDRYTEKARRVIFFARYEASQFGSPYIETEHLLLGLLREDKEFSNRVLRSQASVDAIRKQIEGRVTIREKVSVSVDLPLSNESKRVLAYAAEEAERLSHRHIGTEHLLLGMLREESCLAAEILHSLGLSLSKSREGVSKAAHSAGSLPPSRSSAPQTDLSRDLTQSALDRELDPLVGRADELQAVLHALGSRNRNSVVLVGEAGIGKTAIVEGLAQCIAGGKSPMFLADKRILTFDLGLMAAGTTRAQFAERMSTVLRELASAQNSILFLRELTTLAGTPGGALDAINILRPALERGDLLCITEATSAEYEATVEKVPWFAACTRTVQVPPMNDREVLQLLRGQKARLEKYHSVSYSDEALQRAAQHANGNAAKAIDMADSAGTLVKLSQRAQPEDVTETEKKIRFIVNRMEDAIANHEFEKARFYSEEERKERENLRLLRKHYHLSETSNPMVRLEDMESAIARAGC